MQIPDLQGAVAMREAASTRERKAGHRRIAYCAQVRAEGREPALGKRPSRRRPRWMDRLRDASVVVARHPFALGNLLVFDGGLQHHAVRKIIDEPALDLLPGRLVRRILVAAVAL